MSGPHVEEPWYRIWREAYAEGFRGGFGEGFRDGWDRGLDVATTRLWDRLPAKVRVELGDLAAAPEGHEPGEPG